MSIQVLVIAPIGIVKQWMNYDAEGGRGRPAAVLPPGDLMPGTRAYQGNEACHINWIDTYESLQAALHPSMTLVGAQEFRLTQEYDEEGNPVGELQGVYTPVSAAFVNYLEDVPVFDEEGNQTGTERPQPGVPMHVFAGSDQWVWGEEIALRPGVAGG